jgi:DNA-binding HxlR family transcriptional regulator
VFEVSRRYDDPCGIARALNAVGERWSLLIVRELVYSAKRFSDLRRGLGGISPNVLSQRLVELERDGVVSRRAAGPPISTTIYELTTSGRDLFPVLEALARWGKHRPIHSARPLSRDAIMLAMQTTVSVRATVPAGLRVTLDGTSWDPVIDDGTLDWRAATDAEPSATLEVSSPVLHRMVFRGFDLDEAMATGQVNVTGDRALITSFTSAFQTPNAATPTPSRNDTPGLTSRSS